MKQRALSILLAVTFLLSISLFCTTAFAASDSADGIVAELLTDKQAYENGEAIDVKLEVKNYNPRANRIRTELMLPNGVRLSAGSLVNDGAALAPNQEANFSYGLQADNIAPSTTTTGTTASSTAPTTAVTTTPTTAATTAPATAVPTTTPTTVAGTTTVATTAVATTVASGTGNVTPGGPSDTGDTSVFIFGALAVFSLVGLVVVSGGKRIFKQRWFVMVLCAALLLGVAGPVVTNAASSNSFTISTTITVDDVPVVLKAVISYEIEDDAVYTDQVEFKADGQFLWNKVVEQGYFLPSEVIYNGEKTSKNGDNRPEVNAPYIDMLFGTANKTGEFTADIFNTTAQQSVLIGLTDDPASKLALELIDEDEWIIALIDGKLVVTGWYDNATAAAARALYALGSVDTADIALNLPMIGKMNYVDVELPEFTAGTFLGAMDSDFGAVIMRYNEITADDFDAYCTVLEASGYELYESNTMDGFKQTKTLKFATYVKGNDAILVQYLPVSLLDQDPNTLTAVEKKAYDATFRADGDAIRLILTSTDLLSNNAAANTGWTNADISPKLHLVNGYDKHSDGNNIGLSQIFTLADGSYVVIDGGIGAEAEDLYYTMRYMNEREDGEIVVAAWILTHAHNDHTGALGALATSEWADEITIEQVVLNHVAKSYRWRTEYDPYGYPVGFSVEFASIYDVVDNFAQGEDFELIMPHMGQVMHIRNAQIEFLTVGDEDVYPVIFNNDNAQSLVFRVTFPETTDQEIMILADSALDQTYDVFFPLMTGELHAEILQVAHHGLSGQTSRFYPMFTDVEVAIWPTTWSTIHKNDSFNSSTNVGLRNFDPLDIVCEEYVQTLAIPFNKENDQVIRTKIDTHKTKYQAKEMDISLLPAIQFQGTWRDSKDTLINYLKKYTSDVLILPLIDQNATAYNNADLVNDLYDALDYAYIYYAPVWGCDADADMDSGDGTVGHVILSVYPILNAETGILKQGSVDSEGRGYAHILLDVERTELDLVATHFKDATDWTEFADTYEQWGDYTVIAGNTKIGGNVENASVELTSSAFDSDVTILGSKGIVFADMATNNDLANSESEFYVNANLDSIYTATMTIPVSFDMQPNTIPIRQAFISWWCHSWGQNESAFDTIVAKLREQNAAVVALQNVCNSTIGITDPDNYAKLLGYEYSYFAVLEADTQRGNFLLSHYPIEPQADLMLSDGSDNEYGDARVFGHVIVNMDGTKTDVWFGTADASAEQIAKLTEAVKGVADLTGRPFVISTNDISSLKDLEYFAGYQCFNYYTNYVANVLVSTGPITITNTEAVYSGIDWAGVDSINILDYDLTDGQLTKEPEPLPDVPDANPNGLDVALVPAFYFNGGYSQNASSIHNALVNLGADVLAITRIDKNTTSNNNMDVPGAISKALKSVYPHSYTMQVNSVDGGYECHLLLSKYEILETEDIALGNETGDYVGVGYSRAMLAVDGLDVDVFFGWMNKQNFWSELAPYVKASEADAWVVVGEMAYAFPEKSGIESALGQTISAAYEHYGKTEGGYHYCNILSSNNGTFSNAKYEACTDRFGDRADPLYQATITFPAPEGVPAELNVALVPAFYFNGGYSQNATSIHEALINLGADVLAITRIDKNTTSNNNMDVPGAISEALKSVYPYSYTMQVNSVDGGYECHLLLSKYEILETEDIALGNETGDYVGVGYARAMLAVDGLDVDVFFGWMNKQNFWSELAPYVKASEADAWVVVGEMAYAFPEKSGIESALGQTISAAYEHYGKTEGGYHYCNILSSNNGTFSNAKYEACTDRFGDRADPLYQAVITFPKPEDTKPESVEMNVALVPAFYFNGEYSQNATSIHEALVNLGADVLAITRIDKNTTSNNNMDVPGAISEALKSVYPYSYTIQVNSVDGGYECHLLLSKYEILESKDIALGNETGDYVGVGYSRAMLDVDGLYVDAFFGWMNHQNFWSELAPDITASEADAWMVVGDMAYAFPEKSGIESALGQTISAAYEHYGKAEGGYHYCNILSSNNGTFSNAKYEACTDRFGDRADPLYQAVITFVP